MSAHTVSPLPDPARAGIPDPLQQPFAPHRCDAPFRGAYPSMQQTPMRGRPRELIRVCNAMADPAASLGAVEHAQLLDGNTSCTPR